jgi:hypothetical protein
MSHYEALCVHALAWLVANPLSTMPSINQCLLLSYKADIGWPFITTAIRVPLFRCLRKEAALWWLPLLSGQEACNGAAQ